MSLAPLLAALHQFLSIEFIILAACGEDQVHFEVPCLFHLIYLPQVPCEI